MPKPIQLFNSPLTVCEPGLNQSCLIDFVLLQANFCDNRGNRMKSETDFAIIGLHVHPKNANQEIDKLDDVKKWTKKR
jgi:hypothetical protein